MLRTFIFFFIMIWANSLQAQTTEPVPLSLSPQDTTELSDVDQLGEGVAPGSPQVTGVNVEEARFGDWFRVCTTGVSPRRCEVIQSMQMQTEEGLGQLLRTVFSRTDQGLLVVQKTLPNGLDLRPGIAIQFGDSPEFAQPFLTCSEIGCTVVYALSDQMISQLLTAEDARIGFRPLNSDQTLVLEISFDGLAQALDAVLNP